MIFRFAMTAKFDGGELTRAQWSKPVVVIAIFTDVHATFKFLGYYTR
jgi:hypothetical protein